MDLNFQPNDIEFQKEVRSWLEANLTDDLKQKIANAPGSYLEPEEQISWQKKLYSRGWMGTNWPKEYGGAGFTSTQKFIFNAEFSRVGAPAPIAFGVTMVAPVIMKFGTPEQKAKYLPDILQSKVWWCQGYSEPGSGSDLASLSTKAEDKGDHWLVNGAKTWTTKAQHADMMFCLVRTAQENRRQDGITFMLFDMNQPGIEVKPIVMSDSVPAPMQEINTVFLNDVVVPKENILGEVGKGWTCAKYLLEFERGNASSPRLYRGLNGLRDIAVTENRLQESEVQMQLASFESQIMALEATEIDILGKLTTGQNVGPNSSMMKTRGTELSTQMSEMAVELCGNRALPYNLNLPGSNKEQVMPNYAAVSAPAYFNHRKEKIYAGSNEVQRNIMAKLVLGLS